MNLLKITLLALSVASVEVKPDNWFTNKEEAFAFAQLHNEQILMVFAGSDWCRPCIQLKQDILISEEFEDFSKDRLAILYLDFPSKNKNKLSPEQIKHNEALAEKYNMAGKFPKIILFDKDLKKLKEITFRSQLPAEFIREIKAVK
ncbi:MAG: hypothetical protein DHS20C18_20590 [Saprospiraceae bacterium]|nr:MAG: hypothetical protein DHS20C18_20590 [Saprospiraceae bacterium]